MLLKLFKQSKPIILIFVLILAIISRIFLLLQLPDSPNYADQYPLFSGLWNFLSEHSTLSIILSFLLQFTQASWMNRIAVSNGLVKPSSLLPVLLYILFTSSFHTLYLSPIILGQLFILLAIDRLLRIYPAKNVPTNLFNASLLLSIGTILCPEILILSLSIVLFMFIYGLSEFRNWLVSIIGFLLPFLFFVTYEVTILNTDTLILGNYLSPSIKIYELITQLDWSFYIAGIIGAIYFVMAFSDLNKAFSKKNIQKRYSLSFILWTTPLILVYQLFNNNPAGYILLCIPMTLLLSNYYMHKRESLKIHLSFNLLLLLLIFGIPLWTLFQ